MADNRIELIVEVDVNRANASIKAVNKGLSSFEQAAKSASQGASRGIDGFTVSVAKGAAAGALLAQGLEKVVGWLKTVGVETVKYAARTETLAVVTAQLARVNDYDEAAVARLVERVKKLGITTQEAHGVIQQMIFAELDLAKATELARVAQNAAVIAGVNSSEAFKKMILGITTGQTRLLHNLGLQVSLEQVIQEGQRTLGRALSEREKREWMLNNVLQEGIKIRGLYEKAMEDVGKQMTSLPRYVAEARNALGKQFRGELATVVKSLTELAKWTERNAAEIVSWGRIVASGVVTGALVKFVTWLRAGTHAANAFTAAIARHPLGALFVGLSMAGTGLYQMYQRSKELESALQAQNKAADDTRRIFYHIGRGVSIEQLRNMGYTVDQIRTAFLGAKEQAEGFLEMADQAHFGLVVRMRNLRAEEEERKRQAAELAAEMAKKQRELERQAIESAIAAERALITGPGRALVELLEKARKATVFVDTKGIEHQMRMAHGVIENMEREYRARSRAAQVESLKETTRLYSEEAERRMAWDAEVYQQRLAYDLDIAQRNLEHIREIYREEEAATDRVRDAELRQLEAYDAQTIEQKAWVEQRKAEIEIDHIEKVHEIRMRLFDLETSQRVMEYELEMRRLGYRADEIERRIAEYTQQRETVRQAAQEATDSSIQAARESAATRTATMVRDQNQRIFESLKQQAGGVFDALLQKSQTIWSAIADSFKTAILTAIKEIVTSRVAAMLMYLLGGQRVGFAAGRGGILGGAGGLLGAGAVPVLGAAGPIPGGMGGGWGTPPFLPGAPGGAAPGIGIGGFLPGLKSFLGIGGSVPLGPGMATTWEAASTLQKLSAIGKSSAALMGGAMLAMGGLQRGGISGLAMTAAGGGLIGFKFGGPVGAAIGAGIGAMAGLVRLFMKSAEEKAREKIKAAYGVDISDKGVLRQIVETAKQAFGGNMDLAIQSPQIRDLIELYALSTGQQPSGLPGRARPTTLVQSRGSLYESPSAGYASSLSPDGMDMMGAGRAQAATPVAFNLQIDGKTVGTAIVQHGRIVTEGAISAMKGNAGRRQMTALQMSPGTILA